MKYSITLVFFALFINMNGQISIEQEVYLEEDTISGTLVTPIELIGQSKNDHIPLVIMIPGSGPTDRNGNSGLARGENNTFKHLADSLSKRGIASYRFDKPGVGKSTLKMEMENFTFKDNIRVVSAIVTQLKEKISFKTVILMGHSEGSLVGMLSAQNNDVQGYISLAGPAQNACEILKDQMLVSALSEELKAQVVEKLDSLAGGYEVKKFSFVLSSLLNASIQPYIRSWFNYTPTIEIKKLEIPVLIVQGGRDIQVPVAEGEGLKKAQPKSKYLFFPEMNHVLKNVGESRDENLAAYTDPDFPFPATLISELSLWILAI